MNLQNGYKVIYEKIADGKRTFYATRNVKCDPSVDTKLVEATIGEYKLIYEKNGRFYGSETGIPAADDHCFEGFDEVFIKKPEEESVTPAVEEPATTNVEEPAQAYTRRASSKKAPVVEEPVETPVVEENNETEV